MFLQFFESKEEKEARQRRIKARIKMEIAAQTERALVHQREAEADMLSKFCPLLEENCIGDKCSFYVEPPEPKLIEELNVIRYSIPKCGLLRGD